MGASRIRVGAVSAVLESGDTSQRDVVMQALSAFDPRAVHTWQYRQRITDGFVRLVNRVTGEFPAGLTWRARNALITAGYPSPTIEWGSPPPTLAPLYDEPVAELRDYQLRAVATALRARRVLLKCATGGGKTLTAMEVVRQLGYPALWLTHRRGLVDQTERVAAEALGRKTAREFVHVRMVPTLANRLGDPEMRRYLASFKVVVMDEAHRAGAPTWLAVSDACTGAAYRIGLSASPDTGNAVTNLRIEGAIGPTYHVAGASELAALGFLAKPRVIVLRPPKSSYPKYEDVRDAVVPGWRSNPTGLMRAGAQMYAETYDRGVINNDDRHRAVVDAVMGRMAAGERVLVLCASVPHAKILAEILGARLVNVGGRRGEVFQLDGGSPDELRETTLVGFKATRGAACLVATPFFREGYDLPQIDVGFTAGGGLSDVANLQGFGRMLRPRPDKSTVDVYEVYDDDGTRVVWRMKDGEWTEEVRSNYLRRHSEHRLGFFEEQGFEIVDLDKGKT
jgi:superfamily II DNA or RNA helicase